ncbi:sigma-54 interaction domain-containing protein [Chrysiogenes arsenatis]|uniref:sigma-54 interaction domain-containing protein n=1 Tax=Chrysiogenes arsenatis TaxID=309797 RepID=UPI0006851859|nr:sigma-54 dependent transcriptional regulator [Chrysiogenes arsenatis]
MNHLESFQSAYQQLSTLVDTIPDIVVTVLPRSVYKIFLIAGWVENLFETEAPLLTGSILQAHQEYNHLHQVCAQVESNKKWVDNHLAQIGSRVLLVSARYYDSTQATQHPFITLRLHDVSKMGFIADSRTHFHYHGLIGKSPQMVEIFRRIDMYAKTRANILITGETGTGKEVVANAIHTASHVKGEFVALNCSAISDQLIESELFGHERGSFTGAFRTHRGKFERADKGTLFLDEVGDMPLHAQAKLLRVLEDGIVERVGGESTIRTDVRVVAATNIPLEDAITRNAFRADLFYRLSVFRIHIPPLRERPVDIPLLVRTLLARLNEQYRSLGKQVIEITPEAMQILTAWTWPGNVRELSNTLERIFIESSGPVITAADLRGWYHEKQTLSYRQIRSYDPASEPVKLISAGTPPMESNAYSRNPRDMNADELRTVLRQVHGNKTRAAQVLGIDKSTLYRKLKRFGIHESEC